MSYYSKEPYIFSNHALQRIKERIELPSNQRLSVKKYISSLIMKSTYQFIYQNYLYVSISDHNKNYDMYAVIDESSKVVVTVSRMSRGKILNLL